MTDTTISAGQTSAGFIVSSGDTLTVLAGGTANTTTVQSGGTAYIYGVESGGLLSGGTDPATFFQINANEIVYAGGSALGDSVYRGSQTISSGGYASGTVLSRFGGQIVSSGGYAAGTTVLSGAQSVLTGATASGTVVSAGQQALGINSGAFQGSGGTSIDTFLVSKGTESVYSGGVASHTIVNGSAALLGLNGGTAVNAIVYAGSITVNDGMLSNATISAGNLYMQGGVATGTTIINGLVVATAGQLLGTVVSGGGTVISALVSGTVLSGTTLYGSNPAFDANHQSASLTIFQGAVASNTVLNSNTYINANSGGTTVQTTIYSGAVETVNVSGTASNTILSGGRLVINSGSFISGIEVHSGGSIDVNYLTYNAADSVSVTATGLLTVTSAGTTVYTTQLTGSYVGDYFHATADTDGSLILTEDNTPCYCPGTLIATDKGEVLVEELAIGDRVLNHKGEARAIKWIGHRAYSGRFATMNREILPICFKAGSIAENTPRRDLWVSPHHAFYLNGVLIEAKDLANGVSIYQASSVKSVKYFHVELDSHDVIIAEGALAESFVDDNGRGIFHNAHEYAALYTDAEEASAQRYYAPRVDAGEEVEAARAALDSRAEAYFSVALKSVA